MPKAKGALNKRQALFCREYVVDFNARQAYIRAGYAPKFAEKNVTHLLALPHVKAEIARLQGEQMIMHGDLLQRNLEQLVKIAYSSIDNTIDLSTGSPVIKQGYDGSLVESVGETANGLKVKHHSKLQAIDLINKMLGAYQERVDVTSGGKPIEAGGFVVTFEVVPPRNPTEGDGHVEHNDTV